MHDIKLIRDDPAAFDNGLKRRGLPPQSAEVLKRDADLRALLTRLQTAQARRNEASKLIGQAKAKKDEAQAQALMAEVAGLKDEIQKGEERATGARGRGRRSSRDHPESPGVRCARRRGREGQSRSSPRRLQAGHELQAERAFRSRREARPDGFRGRGAHVGRALRGAEEGTRAPRTRHRAIHARSAHGALRLHRSLAAAAGARSSNVRHGAVAEIL